MRRSPAAECPAPWPGFCFSHRGGRGPKSVRGGGSARSGPGGGGRGSSKPGVLPRVSRPPPLSARASGSRCRLGGRFLPRAGSLELWALRSRLRRVATPGTHLPVEGNLGAVGERTEGENAVCVCVCICLCVCIMCACKEELSVMSKILGSACHAPSVSLDGQQRPLPGLKFNAIFDMVQVEAKGEATP